jgi:hypothetical protein
MDQSLCSCSKTLPPALHNDGSDYPTPSEIAQEIRWLRPGLTG